MKSLIEAHAEVTGEKNNTIIPNIYVDFLDGDYTAAVALKELVNWSVWATKKGRDGWFNRNEDDWQQACRLSRKQVNRSITVINAKAPGLIEKSVRKIRTDRGVMLAETATHYRVNPSVYDATFGNSGNGDGGNSGNVPSGKSGNSPSGKSFKSPETFTGDIHSSGDMPQEQDSPPESPVKELKNEKHERTVAMVQAWAQSVNGGQWPTAKGKALQQARQMVDNGFTADDVPSIIRWLKSDPFWKDKPLDFGAIYTQADKWRQAHPTPTGRQMTQEELLAIDSFRDWVNAGHYEQGYEGMQRWLSDRDNGTLPQFHKERS